MGNDICPYVFCPKCKSRNSWVRNKVKDVIAEGNSEILWKGWQCKYCGDIALEPVKLVKESVGVAGNEANSYSPNK